MSNKRCFLNYFHWLWMTMKININKCFKFSWSRTWQSALASFCHIVVSFIFMSIHRPHRILFLFFSQDPPKGPIQWLRWPRELQWPSVVWEPDVRHQHEANRGESCPIRHHTQHSVHGGIVQQACHCLHSGSSQPPSRALWRGETQQRGNKTKSFKLVTTSSPCCSVSVLEPAT